MEILARLINSCGKIVLLDGFMSNCSLSVCANFAENLDQIRLIIGNFKVSRGTLQTLPPALTQSKKSSAVKDSVKSVEGILNILDTEINQERRASLLKLLERGTLFQNVKLDYLRNGLKTVGPINSVRKYAGFAANNLQLHNKIGFLVKEVAWSLFNISIPLKFCNLIGKYVTREKPLWRCQYYHKNASHFTSDEDVITAMRTSDEFAYSSVMTKGVSFDDTHFDVLNGLFTPNANLPISAAQQMVRARSINFKSGIVCVSNMSKQKDMHLPLQYKDNIRLCLDREDFSLNILDD